MNRGEKVPGLQSPAFRKLELWKVEKTELLAYALLCVTFS